jgi:poly(hydroxyalkanoate) granule-associated protein
MPTTKTLKADIKETINGANGVVSNMDVKIEKAVDDAKEGGMTMLAMVRKVLQAAVGAFALTVEEVEEFVARLVERGEIAEQDGRKLIADIISRRRDETEATVEKMQEQSERQWARAEAMLDHQIDNILARLNVPSKHDIQNLSHKVAELAEKVDALR